MTKDRIKENLHNMLGLIQEMQGATPKCKENETLRAFLAEAKRGVYFAYLEVKNGA